MLRRTFIFAAPVALVSACSSAESEPALSAPTPVDRDAIADVIYRPGATDEGLLTFLNAEPVALAAAAPVITAPADGSQLATATTFEYHAGTTALGRARRRRAWSWPDWLTLERSAFAHGAPMNGDAFFLVFSTSRDAKLLRVFTEDTSYVPTADEWQRLTTAGETIELRVTRAIFDQGHLTADGGPFPGAPIHFTLAV